MILQGDIGALLGLNHGSGFHLGCTFSSPGEFSQILMPRSTSGNSDLIFLVGAGMVFPIVSSGVPICPSVQR